MREFNFAQWYGSLEMTMSWQSLPLIKNQSASEFGYKKAQNQFKDLKF